MLDTWHMSKLNLEEEGRRRYGDRPKQTFNANFQVLKMSTYFEDILKKLGWEDGFQIPVANAENQLLEQEVAKLTLQKIKAKTLFDTSTVKLDNIENHLKYVNQESEQTQNLITAHIQQLQSEEHKLRTNQAIKKKYDYDIKQFNKNICEIKERQQIQKNQLEKCTRKLDTLKSETDWDSEALKAWEESLQKRDEDNELIKKFSKQDMRKYNELEAKRQNLEVEYGNRKQTVEKMVNDLNNYERMLERTGKIMKQQIVERSGLIRQWKDSVKILQQRDADIDRIQVQIIEMQEIIEKEQEKLEEQKQFYEAEVKSNNDLEYDVQQINFFNSKIRRELNELQQQGLLLNNKADTVRRRMIASAQQLEKLRTQKKTMNETISLMEQKIAQSRTVVDSLKQKFENLKQSTLTVDERIKHLEKLIDYEQRQQVALIRDVDVLQNAFIRVQHEMQEQIHIGKVKDLEISGVRNNINHLQKHNEDERKALGKRKEDAYELDYKIDEVQRKILITENVIHNEDKEELEFKLLELENKVSEHAEIKNMLKDQVHKIRDDMRRLTTAIVADQSQLVILKDKLQHQNLSYEGGKKQAQSLKNNIQEKQVEETILRLRVNQLDKSMKKEKNSIYTLEKFKLTLEQATKERLLQIDTNKEILFVKRRNLIEEKGRLKCDINERLLKMEQIKKKYDIILMSLGKDDDGQTLTVTHFKIKNAQEKYLLQQEGDELDSKIKKAEKEILAMENTLKVVNLTNAAFKQSLSSVEDEGKEVDEMKALENKLLMVNDVLREKRKELAAKRQAYEEIQEKLTALKNKTFEAKEALVCLEKEYFQIQKEKNLKEEKLKRAETCLKIVEKKISAKEKEKYDRDLEIRQLRDTNISVMQRLVEMSIRYQEVAPLITRYTIEYEVKLPEKRRLSTLSARTESTRSTHSCGKEPDSESKSSKSDSRLSSLSKVDVTFRV